MHYNDQRINLNRIVVTLRAKYRNISFKNPGEWLECTLLNLSKNGSLIEGKYSFVIGDLIELTFTLDGILVMLHAEVVNNQGKHAGAKFVRILKKDQEVIRNYINSYYLKKTNH